MTRETKFLRLLLAMLLLAVVLSSGFLYLLSLASAQHYPEVAHLRLPIYLAVLVGFIPVVVAIKLAFDFLGVIDRGDAFSTRTVQILRRMKLLIGAFAGYLALGLAGFEDATNLMGPKLLLPWFVIEVVALLLFTKVASLERIFVVALKLRDAGHTHLITIPIVDRQREVRAVDNELTV